MELYDTYTIPTYAVMALEYGDYSGIEEEDIALIEEFNQKLPSHAVFVFGEETYFSIYPEFGLACECVDLEVFA